MGTINSALAVISSGLNADQSALNIVANNVANVNTAGYTREIPTWSESTPLRMNGIDVGTGVASGVTSIRDRVLSQRLIQQQQIASSSSARLSALNDLQALFTPVSGASLPAPGDIGSDITSFFSSFASLEANATNNALRQQVLSSATTLAGDISNAAASITAQRSAVDQEAEATATQINALTTAIAELNQQIQSVGSDAGTLEDQRQHNMAQLAQLIGIRQVATENGGLSITTTSGQLLVSASSNFSLSTGRVAGVTHFFLGATDLTAELSSGGGELGGYLAARDQDIPQTLNRLDQLAYGITRTVNTQNNGGTDLDGTEGTGTDASGRSGTGATPLYIFSQPQQVAGSAFSMKVVMTNPNEIAAARFGGGDGDNSNARVMANLADQILMLPSATTQFSMTQNLSSTTPALPPANLVIGSEQVYDSLGNNHRLLVNYSNQGGGQWTYSISLADQLNADISVAGQVSFAFGSGETIDPSTDLLISGYTSSGTAATIAAPSLIAGEPLGDSSGGYVKALNDAITAAGIVGVSVTGAGGVLTITGASSTTGSLVANATASANATGTLQFDGNGNVISPSKDISGITFSGFAGGAADLNLHWMLYGPSGSSLLTQTAAPTSQTAQAQNGGIVASEDPSNFYASFVSTLGSSVSQVQIANTAQNASVTQLQTEQNALSGVNLNDEAAAMQRFERSYQAASEVFAILNNLIASALNLGVQTAVS